MGTEKVGFDVVGRDAGASKVFKQVGDAAEKAGDQVEDLGKQSTIAGEQVDGLGDKTEKAGEQADDAGDQYRGLAREIAEAEAAMRALAAEIDRTGNKDLFKDLRRQRAELRRLMSARNLLPNDDDDEEVVRFGARLAQNIASGLSNAGGPISEALSKVFGTLPPQAQMAIGAGVVGAAVAAAPVIGAVISGAVVGAAGVGGIVGGVVIASKHPAVIAAATQTGDEFTRELQRAAVSFVPATVESLSIVRSEIGEIGDDLERAFSASSTMLPGLTEDVMAGATRAVEGFATAVERSGPVVAAIGYIAEQAGDLVGDTFEELSEHAEEGGRALATLWEIFEFGARGLIHTVAGLTITYGLLEKFGALLAGDVTRVVALSAAEEAARQSGGGLSQGLQDLINGFGQTGDKAATAAVEVETLRDAMIRLTGDNISAEQANIRLEEAIDRATEAGRRNNAGIDENTPKGRANREMLVGLAQAANTSAEAIFKQTGSQELASAATTRGRKKFLEAADAMGVEKGEAIALANKLFAIPEEVNSNITVTADTSPALNSARGVVARINSMNARINVYAEPHGSFGGSAHTGHGYSTGMSEGGAVIAPGPKGVDSVWRKLAPGEHVWTAGEVDAVGGQRAMEQLRAAAVGGRTSSASSAMAATRAGAGGGDDGALLAELRAIRRVLASLPIVRLDSGRTTDLYVRGG